MSTIDMSKVAGFKAVDSEGNEMGIVSMNDIVDAVKSSINQQGLVAARQISTLAATSTLADTSTLAATDSYEDQLPQKTDVTWVRGLDADGNPILISKQSLSSVLEGLLFKGYITDANIETTSLALVTKSQTSNIPDTIVASGALITIKLEKHVVQQLYGLNDFNRFTRVKAGDNWNKWIEF